MGASRTTHRTRAGRLYDPVFLCMVGAMVLAVASSVTLRAVMAGAGQLKSDPDTATAVNNDADGQPHLAPLPRKLPSAHLRGSTPSP